MVKYSKQPLLTLRAAQIFRQIASLRDDYVGENDYFRMPDLWEYVADDDTIKIRTYVSSATELVQRKAGVVRLGDRVTLIVDDDFWNIAKCGENFSNFILAHEFCHVELGHHSNRVGVKNFKLTQRKTDFANISPNAEEFETDFAATVLQCGKALLNPSFDVTDLARRAHSDFNRVELFAKMCRLDVFRHELDRNNSTHPQVIL